jgi:hypothetical protein
MERLKPNLEALTLPFRFIVPVMLSLLFYCYHNDQIQLHSDVGTIKDGQEKVWNKISTVETKLDAVQAKEVLDYEYLLQHDIEREREQK